MIIQAELSLYPLGRDSLYPVIDEFIRGLSQPGITVKPGAMSTVITGERETVFQVVSRCFEISAQSGAVVLSARFSNACPVTGHGEGEA